jgi:uncharacterized protein
MDTITADNDVSTPEEITTIPTQAPLPAEGPTRKVQLIEVLVFLFLVLPATGSAYFVLKRVQLPFTVTAITTMLSDLALVCLLVYFTWRNREPLSDIGWTFRGKEVLLGVALFLPVALGAGVVELLARAAGATLPAKTPSFLTATGISGMTLASAMALVVAFAEETVFRGYLILRFKNVTGSTAVAVLLSTALFAAGHGYEGPAGIIGVFYLGLVFALIYRWRSSLIAPMVMHFLQDFISLVVVPLLKH